MDVYADAPKTTLEQMVPKSLDDIIRANRDRVCLRQATDEEIFGLHAQIEPGQVKHTLQDWFLITLSFSRLQQQEMMLLGDKENGHGPLITSVVREIDLDRQLLITNSDSLYALGKPGIGEPEMNKLICVCAAFHSWGIGLSLGVPHFFY